MGRVKSVHFIILRKFDIIKLERFLFFIRLYNKSRQRSGFFLTNLIRKIMKKLRVFLIITMALTMSGINFLPQAVNAFSPIMDSAAFIDFDHNGTIDRVKVVFNGNIDNCKFEAGDWALGAGSVGLIGPTGILNGSGVDANCDGSTNYFYLLVEGASNKTGYPGIFVPADLDYTNQGNLGSVTALGVFAPDQTLVNIDDNASPVIVSTSPATGATGISISTPSVSVTFSEPMQTGTVSLSISEGSWGAASWSGDNTTLTRSRLSTLPYDVNIVVTTTGEDKSGYLISSGNPPAVANPWNFRTAADVSSIVSASESRVSAAPASITANGSSVSVITVTVKNSFGGLLPGKIVTLSGSRGSTDTVIIVNDVTNADGNAFFQVRSNTTGSTTLTAVADGTTIGQTAVVTFTAAALGPVSVSRSSVFATPASVTADNSSYSTVYVTVRDASDNLLSGKTVTLSSSRGSTDTISIINGTTNSSGQATFQVKSGTTGTATLTAVADGTTISATTTVTFAAASTSLIYGDLFKESGSTAVYYYGDDGKRHVFPTQAIYFSWYSDFSTIKTVAHSTVTSVPLGGNVLAKPGTYLVQFVSMDTPFRVLDPKVYVLTATGQLRWITSASTAASLYGADWEKKIIAVPEVYKTNYGNAIAGADVNGTADYSRASVEAAARTISDLY